jgi:hypothetical protein
MFQHGIRIKNETISSGPTRCPDSGEIGQGKEIGDLKGTQTWGPKGPCVKLTGHQDQAVLLQELRAAFELTCSTSGLKHSLGKVPGGETMRLLS